MINKIKKFFNKGSRNDIGLTDLAKISGSMGLDTSDIEISADYAEIIYFTCLKHLSETMGKMPWEKRQITEKKGREKILDNKLDFLLNIRPNPYVTASQFWATTELNKLHYGNAYIYIETDKKTGYPKALWQLPAKEMEVWIDNAGILDSNIGLWYIWTDVRTSKRYSFAKEEILHFKSQFTFDGLVGIPIKEILKTQINTNKHAEGFLNKFYKSGMFGSKVAVFYPGVVEKAKEMEVVKKAE